MSAPRVLAVALLLAAFLVSSIATRAFAQSDGVVVSSFSGPRGAVVRRQVVAAIDGADGLEVVDEARAERVARERGAEAEDPAVLEAVGARAYVEGRVHRGRRRWAATIRVIGPDGSEMLTERIAARRFGALTARVERWVDDGLLGALSSLPGRAAAPPVEAAPPEEPPERSEPNEPALADLPPAPASGGIAPFAVSAGVSVTHRAFDYSDDLFSALRGYSLPAAPFLRFGVEYFPGEHTDSDLFRGFSVAASGALSPGLQTVGGNGTTYPTDAWSFGLDLRYRLRVDDVTFRIDAGYHATVFTIHDANELSVRPAIPNAETHSLRAGAGLRWSFGLGLFFEGFAAYLHPLALGEIGTEAWFPRATAGGLDVEGGLGIVIDDVELAALFTMSRFFYDMHSEPGDARVAGGAVDEYLSGLLRVTFRPSGL